MPSTSVMAEIAACPPLPTAANPSTLPSLTSPSPPVSNSSHLLTQCQPLHASCCTPLLFFSWFPTIRLKMFGFCFLYIICVKIIINIFIVQSYIADCVSCVCRLILLDLTNKLDLQTCSWNRTHSHVGDLPTCIILLL